MKPTLNDFQHGLTSRSPNDTAGFATALTTLLPENTTLALHGDLGTGKTTFVQGIARALGIMTPVTSPTYAIFSTYENQKKQLVHLDAYRLMTPADADNLLIWDLLREPWILAIEWPEKLGDRLPENAFHIHFSIKKFGEHHIQLKINE